jgi:hypothetical protein
VQLDAVEPVQTLGGYEDAGPSEEQADGEEGKKKKKSKKKKKVRKNRLQSTPYNRDTKAAKCMCKAVRCCPVLQKSDGS